MVTLAERSVELQTGIVRIENSPSNYRWSNLVRSVRKEVRKEYERRVINLYLRPDEVINRLSVFSEQSPPDFPPSTLGKIKNILEQGEQSSRQPYKLWLKVLRWREEQLRKKCAENSFNLNGNKEELKAVIKEQLAMISVLYPRKFNNIVSGSKKA